MIQTQGRLQDFSEGVLDLFRNKKNPELETKRPVAGEFFF